MSELHRLIRVDRFKGAKPGAQQRAVCLCGRWAKVLSWDQAVDWSRLHRRNPEMLPGMLLVWRAMHR